MLYKIPLLLVLLFICNSWAAASSSGMTLEERVNETTLDNGLKVVVVERHSAPVLFALITFRVGSCHESLDRSGLSHFLEHMLGKGTKSIGTSNYKAEARIMARMEEAAREIRARQTALTNWRYDAFDAYTVKVKADLPLEAREQIGADEAIGLREVLTRLPDDIQELPEEWRKSEWMLADRKHNYWQMFKEIIALRVEMAELLERQKQYITESEPLDAIYDPRGAAMHNAFTTWDQTSYMVGLPANCLELYMFLESDRYKNPVFREFYAEREVIMEEMRLGENNPDEVLSDIFFAAAFDAHPYGRPIIGWRSDVGNTLRGDMEEHFRRYYAPNNCQITIIGAVDTKRVFALTRKYFSDWKPAEIAYEVTVREPEQRGEKRITVELDAEPQLYIGWHIPAAPDPDYYALEMMSNILSMGATSRFYRSIFTEKQLTAGSPYAYTGPGDRYSNLFIVDATPRAPHTVEEVETATYAEIDRLKTELVSAREMERIRNRMRAWELGRMRSNQWLAFSLSSSFAVRGDWRATIDHNRRMMAVTPEDIQRAANKYFTKTNRTVAYSVKKETPAVESESPEKK
ncbi:MAG: insulinase family protein [Calditrichaeota bacterium]|nr:insulinase family protein [Calditrichota bacterium]